ncbi:MAG: DNA helicase RecG [Candidatus Omnitrophota bacterium]|nr:MAG: DNA helicase RecG [Candidatus Omnitrophota bacterium]
MQKRLDTPVQYLKGIGPKRAQSLSSLGINSVEDLLYYFPRRYEDRTKFLSISQLKEGEFQTIKAKILAVGLRQSWKRQRFNIFEIAVEDATAKIFCVWFNKAYLKNYFKVGQTLILYGKVQRYSGRLQMNSPEFEIIDTQKDTFLSTGRIVPVYSLPERLSQRAFRLIIKSALDNYLSLIKEFLPYDIRSRNKLLNLAQSLINIHFPQDEDLQKEAYRRLSFEEFFIFQIPLALRKIKKRERPGIAHDLGRSLVSKFIDALPFTLTTAQEKALAEIKFDMARPFAMQRLLQGDVGSGKTIVATIAGIIAVQGGFQAAFMVPTEILAKQHYDKIRSQVTSHKSQVNKIKIGLLTSSLEKKQKERVYQEIKEGKIELVIGTHALLEENLQFKNLGLVVIDEQHKFGVGQRALLPRKGANADVLIMTATPIPRTLAITLYGDLDISVINQLPPGRGKTETLLFNQDQKSSAYDIVKEEIRKGNQAYIVYPVIEESYALDIDGAKKMFSQFKKREFKEFRLGLIHGRMKQEEQDKVMLKFKNKDLDILVSTTVLEVGIDVRGATCILIQNAERFGLSQLHQLRGRIGRGSERSFCILISDAPTFQSRQRLEAMVRYSDGFRIAEEDLKIRGPGEFFGRRQHGLSELKIANPLTQMQLLKKAREEAARLLAVDSRLELKQNVLLREKLLQRFPEYEKLILIG